MLTRAASSLLAKYGFDASVSQRRWPLIAANDNKMSALGYVKRGLFCSVILGILVFLWYWM